MAGETDAVCRMQVVKKWTWWLFPTWIWTYLQRQISQAPRTWFHRHRASGRHSRATWYQWCKSFYPESRDWSRRNTTWWRSESRRTISSTSLPRSPTQTTETCSVYVFCIKSNEHSSDINWLNVSSTDVTSGSQEVMASFVWRHWQFV